MRYGSLARVTLRAPAPPTRHPGGQTLGRTVLVDPAGRG